MGTRERYTAGTPSWVELSTPDQDGAKSYYQALFGWEAQDTPIGENAVYTMLRQDGRHVGAITPQPSQQREAGVPPFWLTYITAQDADAVLARAGELGATVHAGPFDVFDAGRMGVLADPQGAFFAVWQPKEHIGAGLVNAPGAFSWAELAAADPAAAVGFYGDLFGWRAAPLESSPVPYWVVQNDDEHTIGGVRGTVDPEPPNWVVYFGCEAIEATLARATELGGQAVHEPVDIGAGMIVTIRDPQGAHFALYAGRFDD